MAVVAPIELQDPVAARKPARKPDGRHCGLGSGVHQTDFLNRWDHLDDRLGEFDFRRRGRTERRSGFIDDSAQRGTDLGLPVTFNQRSPRPDVIDIRLSVHIPDTGTFARLNKDGFAADGLEGPDGRIHAAGNHTLSTFEKRFGS